MSDELPRVVPPAPDRDGRPGFGVSLTFGGPAPIIEVEGLERVPEDRGERLGDMPARPPLVLLPGGLDSGLDVGPVADVPAAPVDESPGR